uniref:Uncharacterized protein n=1 Tax=Opuntia streptacantha TaxID=393608 RepID=A0A7C8ZR43_OPUST
MTINPHGLRTNTSTHSMYRYLWYHFFTHCLNHLFLSLLLFFLLIQHLHQEQLFPFTATLMPLLERLVTVVTQSLCYLLSPLSNGYISGRFLPTNIRNIRFRCKVRGGW